MLLGTTTLRLTRAEAARWIKITGFVPSEVRSLTDLQHYVGYCKQCFWGTSEDTRFLHFLIDEELKRNLATLPAQQLPSP